MDILETVQALSDRWRYLAVKLGIRQATIDSIKDDCLHKALVEWLRMNYNYVKHERPSWKRLAEAVKDLDGRLFESIAKDHKKK